MSIQSGEILETVKMVADQNFDVRTITIGIDLHDCISSDIDVLNQNIYNKITTVGKDLVATAKHLSAKYGVPIVNQRISVTPIAQILAIRELNIGHSLISQALFLGLPEAVRQMKEVMFRARMLP